MKLVKTIFILGLVAPVHILAQNATPTVGVSVIGGVSGGQTGFLSAGDYNIKKVEQDTTSLMNAAISQLKRVQEIDREYLLETNRRLLEGVNKIVNLSAEFRTLSTNSQYGQVNLMDYIQKVNQIQNASNALDLEIQGLTLITAETLPSASEVQIGDVKASIPVSGNLNLKPLSEKYAKMKADLMSQMDSMQFPNLIHQKTQQPWSVISQALTPNLVGLQILSSKEIDEKTKLMNDNLAISSVSRKAQERLVERLRIDIRKLVENFGNEESFRFRDENDKKAKLTAWENIHDAFLRRSYLRKKYNIPMGALRAEKYDKTVFNFEKITTAFKPLKNYLLQIQQQPAMTREEVMESFENARNFVQLYDERLTPVFKGRDKIMVNQDKKLEFSSEETGLLVRAASAVNFLTGRNPTTEIMLAVMRMVVADTKEEMMLLQNDQVAFNAYYNQRYLATADLKKQTNTKICQIDFTLSKQTHDKICVVLGVKQKANIPMGHSGNDTSGIFVALLNQYQNVELSKRQEVENLRMQIELARKTMSEASQSVEEDLF